MALGGGMSCVKYLLFCFNLLFAITGLIILIVGIKAEVKAHPYIDLTDEAFYTSAPMVLIIIGVIVFIVAFFGCCGAVKENHCMIVTFSAFLLIIFVAELAVGIAGYLKRDDLEASVVRHLNETISKYPTDKDVQNTFDILQTDLNCCGINNASDWPNNNIPYPASCCTGHEITTGGVPVACNTNEPTFHHDACLPKLVNFLKDIALWLGGVGLGIAIVQLLGVIFACCLARSIRSQYETV
ncbi:CD63 antigen-like [Pectinophora gossypiella]|uniref:Tetraspanin n=1 Tax=Pectinophora gossypiella TaxID=13191 RepID=A0A1E1W138_PECGO|nr:CD63 antigen-like [Pectinophora gossypiella]XP_049866839.1 CD63 antigen-like [Pectinophora gossypiella]